MGWLSESSGSLAINATVSFSFQICRDMDFSSQVRETASPLQGPKATDRDPAGSGDSTTTTPGISVQGRSRNAIEKRTEQSTSSQWFQRSANFERHSGPIQPFIGRYQNTLKRPSASGSRRNAFPPPRSAQWDGTPLRCQSFKNPVRFADKRGGFRMMFERHYCEALRDATFGRKYCSTFRHVPVVDPYGIDPKRIRQCMEETASEAGEGILIDSLCMVMASVECQWMCHGDFRAYEKEMMIWSRDLFEMACRVYYNPTREDNGLAGPTNATTLFRVAMSFPWLTCEY